MGIGNVRAKENRQARARERPKPTLDADRYHVLPFPLSIFQSPLQCGRILTRHANQPGRRRPSGLQSQHCYPALPGFLPFNRLRKNRPLPPCVVAAQIPHSCCTPPVIKAPPLDQSRPPADDGPAKPPRQYPVAFLPPIRFTQEPGLRPACLVPYHDHAQPPRPHHCQRPRHRTRR